MTHEPVSLRTHGDLQELSTRLSALLDTDPVDAVRQARQSDLESSDRLSAMSVRAAILVDGGAATNQKDAIEEGLRLFRELYAERPELGVAYNLANALVSMVGTPPHSPCRLDHQERTREQRAEARQPAPGLIFHSDRGSQYASADHRAALEAQGAIASMSRKGDCWDNAVAESFFGSLKQELLYRHSWPTHDLTIKAVGEYVDGFYNARRLHSFIGYTSPLQYELYTTDWRSAA